MWPRGYCRVRAAEIEIVDRHGLLENGVVVAQRIEPLHHRGKVRHVAPADQPRRVAKTIRMFVRGRAEQQRRRVDGAAGDDHERALYANGLASPLHVDSGSPSCQMDSVTIRSASALVQISTFGAASAGSMPHTSASLFAWILHGNELHVRHRTQPPVRPADQTERQAAMGAVPGAATARQSPPCRCSGESARRGMARAEARWDRRRCWPCTWYRRSA